MSYVFEKLSTGITLTSQPTPVDEVTHGQNMPVCVYIYLKISGT